MKTRLTGGYAIVIRNVVAAIALAILAACASLDPQPSFDRVAADVGARGDHQIAWTVSEEDRAAARAILADSPLSLEDAVRVALVGSPALHAEYENLGIAHAQFVRAGLLSNPVFDVSWLDGDAGETLDLGLSMDFLDVFLIPLRKRQAAAAQREAELAVTRAVLERVGQVRQAWIAAVAARQAARHVRRNHALLESLDGVSEALFQAGNITRLERVKAARAMLQNRMALDQAEAAEADAKEALAVAIGTWGALEWDLPDTLPGLPDNEISVESFEDHVVGQSLELEIARANIEDAAAGLELSDRSRLIPDLEVGWSAERDGDLWQDGPTLAFALPVLDTGRAGKAAQQAGLEQSRRQYMQLEIEIRATARRAQRANALKREAAVHMRDAVLPAAAEQVRETTLHYHAAHVGIDDVLDARIEENEAYRQYVDALAAYWSARETRSALLQGVRLDGDGGGSLAMVDIDTDEGGH